MSMFDKLKVLPEDLMFTDLSAEDGKLEDLKNILIASISY